MAGKSSVGGSIGGASSSCSSAEGSCRNETRRRGSGPRGRGAGVPRLPAVELAPGPPTAQAATARAAAQAAEATATADSRLGRLRSEEEVLFGTLYRGLDERLDRLTGAASSVCTAAIA